MGVPVLGNQARHDRLALGRAALAEFVVRVVTRRRAEPAVHRGLAAFHGGRGAVFLVAGGRAELVVWVRALVLVVLAWGKEKLDYATQKPIKLLNGGRKKQRGG